MVQQNPTQSTPNELEQHMPEGLKPAFETTLKYKNQIILAMAAVLAVVAIWSGVRWYNANAQTQARAELSTILQTLTGTERIAKLEELAKSAPSSVEKAVLFELAALCLEEKQYDKAAQYYEQLSNDVDAENRMVAKLGQSKALMLAGKPADAVVILKDMSAALDKQSEDGKDIVSIMIPVNRQLAVAAEQAGDTATAIATLEKLQETGSSDKQFVDFKLNELKNK
ncbi:hypothetical protein [Salidesulfovibrio onnuriiensis]|uniref:hypothetical protein n=1 Tax=Salidesulfovibrio onnuriiensis TaxID=2583823 RepID=UPI0011CB1BA2|nr:hypothetical protein [Salidesulfovibrio onnuriiensis]